MEKSNHNEEKSESSPLLSSLDVKVPVLEGSVTESPRFDDAVESVGVGLFHVLLILVAGWALASDSVEVQCISFVTPELDGKDDHDLNPSSVQKGALDAVIFLGMMVGGYFWGSWSDVAGRRSCLITSLTFNGAFGLASAFSPNYPWFLAFRFLSGVGVGGSIPVAFSYFCEFFTKKNRGPFVIILAMFWVVGSVFVALLAWAVIGTTENNAPGEGPFHSRLGSIHISAWRVYIMLCTFPCISAAIALVFMPESPSFLYTKGRLPKTVRVLRRIDRINRWCRPGSRPPAQAAINALAAEESKNLPSGKSSLKQSVIVIFRSTGELFTRSYLRATVVLLVIWFTFSFGYYGLLLWFPEYFECIHERANNCYFNFNSTCATLNTTNLTQCTDSSSAYVDSLYTALATIPGSLLGVFTINIIGAKLMLAVAVVVSGLSTFLIWLVPKRESLIVVLSAIFRGVTIPGWNALDVISTSNLFPVHLRSTAFGIQAVSGRIGAITGNLAFGALVSISTGGDEYVPILLVASILTFGGLISFFLPSPRGEKTLKCSSRGCRALPCCRCVRKGPDYHSIN